jgi:hypothetical protein
MRTTISLLVVSALFVATGASATTILFNDRTSFLLATGATPVGAIPQNGNTAGILTFGNVPPASVNTSVNWSTLISESFDLAINGVENVDITSSSALYSFGFDFHEPSNTTPPGPQFPDTCNTPTCTDSTFQITLFNGAIAVGTHTFNVTDDILAFIGVSSTDAFNRVEIRELNNTIDNEFFGNFVTGGRVRRAPEPATLALLAMGFAALAARKRFAGSR